MDDYDPQLAHLIRRRAARRRVAAGMPDGLARRISHLAHYNTGAVEAALQRVPLTM